MSQSVSGLEAELAVIDVGRRTEIGMEKTGSNLAIGNAHIEKCITLPKLGGEKSDIVGEHQKREETERE
ncbi:hypothetical protein AB6A40_007051 [Gnathostoma spinigerum]|uniref:Uncharacterized protein n=1 Tax=Gnathostoma spinigerum TaxID=75299 RepID=A0ABD6EUI2_9BILA